MKAYGRVKLFCFKRLGHRNVDRFTVVVADGKKDAAKKEYERQGYTVKTV